MDRGQFQIESVRGTLAFGRLAIVLAFAMNAVGYLGDPNKGYVAGMVLAAVAAGLAYLAQGATCHAVEGSEAGEKAEPVLRLASLAAWAAGVVCFIGGY